MGEVCYAWAMASHPLRIALVIPQGYGFGRGIILGAAGYCLSRGTAINLGVPDRWEEAVHPRTYGAAGALVAVSSAEVAGVVRGWREVDGEGLEGGGAVGGLPVVNVSSRWATPELPRVTCDDVAIGRLGLEHLRRAGFGQVAFCGFADHVYSQRRRVGFESAALATGRPAEPAAEEVEAATRNESGGYRGRATTAHERQRRSLDTWLDALPKPVGVLACNDIRARQVYESVGRLGLRVPDDVAVVGVDNDELVCLTLDPPLSSVDVDSQRLGWEAAGVLHTLLEGGGGRVVGGGGGGEGDTATEVAAPGGAASVEVLIPPRGVVPRGSCRLRRAEDPAVQAALRAIHDRAGQAIGVDDVVDSVGVSRRTLERRFTAELGVSVAEAVRNAHAERAKTLLIDTQLGLEQVASSAGFGTLRQMRMVFAKLVGMPPGEFRERFRMR